MMYNRYIRNDHGTYTRIIEDDTASAAASPPAMESVPHMESESGMPPPQSGEHTPPRSGNMPPPEQNTNSPPQSNTPSSGRSANSAPHGPPPQSNFAPHSGENTIPPRRDSTEQHGPNNFHNNPFQHLFDVFQPEHMENGDLLLLALIFLLSRENADEEVLTALGLLLIL